MFKSLQTLMVAGLLTTASYCHAATPQVGQIVFPDKIPCNLKIGTEVVATADTCDFFKVLETRGEWVKVEVRSVFASGKEGATGWVQAHTVHTFTDEVRFFERTLMDAENVEPVIYQYVGLILKLSSDPRHLRSAIWYFDRAIELDPSDYDNFEYRACCWTMLEAYDRAIADLRTVLRVYPDNEWCKHLLFAIQDYLEVVQEGEAPESMGPTVPATVSIEDALPAV